VEIVRVHHATVFVVFTVLGSCLGIMAFCMLTFGGKK